MIIQLIFSFTLFFLLFYGLALKNESRMIGYTVIFSSLACMVLVWNPVLTVKIANYAGIESGAHLLLYLWIIISGIIISGLHAKIRIISRDITKLTRVVAKLEYSQSKIKSNGKS